MRSEDRYDSLIRYYSDRYGLNHKLVKKQMIAESWDWKRSDVDPQAVSEVGALGLMQIMPNTFDWLVGIMKSEGIFKPDYVPNILNPEDSIHVGCYYDKYLLGRFGEIPDLIERYKFAFSAYNAGIGNINNLLSKAREECGHPRSYSEWKRLGASPGLWQTWKFASQFLHSITGEKHSGRTIRYIDQIFS